MLNPRSRANRISKYVVREEIYLEGYTTTVYHNGEKAGVSRIRVSKGLLPGSAASVLTSEYVIALLYCISLFINDN